jgi:two-component system, cell cycle response regulator
MGNRGRILVVDDDRFYQEFCTDILTEEGYHITTTFTGQEALALVADQQYDLMLLDMVMPGLGGLAVLEQAKQIKPDLDIIIMTALPTVESAVKCLKAGAADYLVKPLNPEELKIEVKRTIELRTLLSEHQEMKSLLTIYENIQRVSSCLEIERLYRLGLDALVVSLGATSGMAIFFDQAQEEVKYWMGMEQDEARMLGDMIHSKWLTPLPRKTKIEQDPYFCAEGAEAEHLKFKSALIFPFRVLDRLEGAMVVFFQDKVLENILSDNVKFTLEQVRRSFENAIRYQDAQRLIFIDDLTGLFNTRYLDLVLQNEMSRARRFKKHIALLFIDLDHFKNVNDNHGHLVGSWMIVESSRIIKSCVRDIDIVVRYGGDEYIVILAETDRQGSQIVAERIRSNMADYLFQPRENLHLHITCCVGVAIYPDDANSKEELIQLADKAMYRGKETTRNVVYYANSL